MSLHRDNGAHGRRVTDSKEKKSPKWNGIGRMRKDRNTLPSALRTSSPGERDSRKGCREGVS